MTIARRSLVLAGVLCILSGSVGPVAARTDPQFAAALATATEIKRTRSGVVRVYFDSEHASFPVITPRLPPNLVTTPSLRRALEEMVQESPTFGRQCARIAAASKLMVFVENMVNDNPQPVRAVTTFGLTPERSLFARVRITVTMDQPELVAHEFEHILEQLDGVDLRTLAKRPSSGVWYSGTRFETERAVAIGRQVASELRAARRAQ
jgi:hypothetical protein